MSNKNAETQFHVSRYIIVYKFILGVFELILGLGIIFYGKAALLMYQNLQADSVFEDPHDLLVTILGKVIPFVLEHQGYIVLLLLLLGIVKIVGAIGMFYKQLWGLDLLIILTVFLLPFQTYNLLAHPSVYQTGYFGINLFIAFYLVKFQPILYIKKVHRRLKKAIR